MKKILVLLISITIFIPCAKGQDSILINNRSEQQVLLSSDTTGAKIPVASAQQATGTDGAALETKFTPNPTRAVIYSAIFPGLGQVYNRKYWKLPIIYGGFIGLSYGISWNGRYYNDYSKAYRSIAGENPRESYYNGWGDFYPGRDPNELTDSQIENLRQAFRRKKDFYRRNRDLCIISAVGVYLICMVDAYVDAQLFDFDLSPNLSLRVEPAVMQSFASLPVTGTRTLGVQCSISF
ncbi:MAG: DUF5683 domain-containing protein [Prevotella sp.]|jgi:hypothetical protein|nr:DUF5683 domain-containing protein [Prevotella sp.]